ncbi:MAG: PorT family protein [Treponema sp.]|jgi:hypothetical protein|nr:PorT family protein [Treponema sp.]
MKKILILACVFSVISANLHAQTAGQFSIGARFGAAMGFNNPSGFQNEMRTWLGAGVQNFNDFVDQPSVNFNFAGTVNYAVTNWFSLQVELNFMVSQGYDLSFSPTAFAPGQRSRELDVDYHSIDIPLLFRLNLFGITGSPNAFGIQAGPHISIPIGRADIYDDTHDGYLGRFEISTAVTFGFTAGIFAGIPLGPGQVVGDLRFIFDTNAVELNFYHGGNVRFMERRALLFTVGYEISL